MKILASIVLAGMAWGQAAGADPDEAEKALRQRVQEFYQLQVEKKFRQAEAYVAADTKDLFYASGKPDIPGFSIVKVVMLDGGTLAEVTVKAKVDVFVMGKGMVPMEVPTTGKWKVENGQWVWFVDQSAPLKTPFGAINPPAEGPKPAASGDISDRVKNFNIAGIMGQVTIDTSSVALTAEKPEASVTITNGMPGGVTLRLEQNFIAGITVKLDKTELKAGEKARVIFTRKKDAASTFGVTKVNVGPLDSTLEVQVSVR